MKILRFFLFSCLVACGHSSYQAPTLSPEAEMVRQGIRLPQLVQKKTHKLVPRKLVSNCQEGLSPSCLKAADILMDKAQEWPKDASYYISGALDFLMAACHWDDPRGCHRAGVVAAYWGHTSMAMDFLEKACQYKMGPACYEMALQEEKFGQNPDVTLEYYRLACTYQYAAACIQSGKRFHEQGQDTLGLEQYSRGCDENLAPACHNAGLLAQIKGEAAASWWEKACGLGYAEACYQLALVELQKKRPDFALPWLQKAAQAGFSEWNVFEFDALYDPLRAYPGFQTVLEQARSNAQKKEESLSSAPAPAEVDEDSIPSPPSNIDVFRPTYKYRHD